MHAIEMFTTNYCSICFVPQPLSLHALVGDQLLPVVRTLGSNEYQASSLMPHSASEVWLSSCILSTTTFDNTISCTSQWLYTVCTYISCTCSVALKQLLFSFCPAPSKHFSVVTSVCYEEVNLVEYTSLNLLIVTILRWAGLRVTTLLLLEREPLTSMTRRVPVLSERYVYTDPCSLTYTLSCKTTIKLVLFPHTRRGLFCFCPPPLELVFFSSLGYWPFHLSKVDGNTQRFTLWASSGAKWHECKTDKKWVVYNWL